jgi:hypothetical protein
MRRKILVFGVAVAVSNALLVVGAAVFGVWQAVFVATIAETGLFVLLSRT